MMVLKKEEDALLFIVGRVQRKKRERERGKKVIVTKLAQLRSLVKLDKKKVKYMASMVFFIK